MSPLLKRHHCLMPLHSGAETVQQLSLIPRIIVICTLLPKIALQACISSFKLSCSDVISLLQPMCQCRHPNSLVFLKVFINLPPPLLLDSVFFVVNASSDLFIIYQVLCSWHSVQYLCEHFIPSGLWSNLMRFL